MLKRLLSFLGLGTIALSLSSCSLVFLGLLNNEESEYVESDIVESTYDETAAEYNHSKKTAVDFSTLSYKTLNNSFDSDTLPQTGDVNILIIPVEINGYKFDDDYKTTIDKAFNGNGSEDTGYWESVSSFYSKSSYGKLNFTFDIADKYELDYTAGELAVKNPKDLTKTSADVVNLAVDDYKNVNGNTSTIKFDSEGDGYIDAVICVYSAPYYGKDKYITSIDPNYDLFWAYCYSADNAKSKNQYSPVCEKYMWLSIDFLTYYGKNMIDAHTPIHETGHLLGLDDYYSYDESRCPAGKYDMMDYNIGDHSSLAKVSLGWVDPIFVYGNAEVTISPFESTGDCIILADSWNGTAFDEYFLIELYTPTGLNLLDATYRYQNKYNTLYSYSGIKMWHVDNRVAKIRKTTGFSSYVVSNPEKLDSKYYYSIVASNSKDRDLYCAKNKGYDLIRLIEAETNVLENTRYTNGYALNNSLFHTNGLFSMNKYQSFFPNSTKLNNGNDFPYKIEFTYVSDSSATIRFTKN